MSAGVWVGSIGSAPVALPIGQFRLHGDPGYVQGDRREALVGDAIGAAAVNAPARREDEPVKRVGIVGVVRDGRVGGDLGRVVHAAQHEVGVVVENLVRVVVGVGFGKPDREAAPHVAAFVPRLDLVRVDAGIGEAKRLGQVVPVRGAQEVRHLDPIPPGGSGIERRER